MFSCLQGTVLDESTEEEEGGEAEHVQVDAHKHPEMLLLIFQSFGYFIDHLLILSLEEKEETQSQVCATTRIYHRPG